ncbi:cornifelin homolog [Rhinatrema bivittatum]|uniref:cornifelin homolog n=1 Tax=Rhinatrema bivittatum TaxID=194408 RepID=UPI00112A762A|nr:cornifelin homolog [Rhinatrema bivittatum]
MSTPVVTQQPGTVPSAVVSPTGEWNSKLCDCCKDCPVCLLGLCCPTILGCYVAHKYGEPFLLGITPGGMTALRTHMRLSYGIRGTICNDALTICCCGWCEMCRMAREIRLRSGAYH